MAQLKIGFTVKAEGLVDLSEIDVIRYKEAKAKGEQVILPEVIREEVADVFNLPIEDIQVTDVYEELIEDKEEKAEGEGV